MENEYSQEQGLYYKNNPNLKAVGVNVEFSEEQIKEIEKCSEDPVYFTKNYVKIISLDDGIVNFKLWDFQEKMLKEFNENRFVLCKLPRQSGKCFSINTPIKLKNKKTNKIINTTIGEFYYTLSRKRSNL